MSVKDCAPFSVLLAAAMLLPACAPVHAQQSFIDQEQLVNSQLGRGYVGLFFSSPNYGYVYTETDVMRTGDGGQSWQFLHKVPANEKVTEIFFLDANTVWIGTKIRGAYPVKLYRTREGFASVEALGGLAFQAHDKPEAGFGDNVFFLDADHGWSSGGNHVLVSTDGGKTWTGYLLPRGLGEVKRIVMFSVTEGIAETELPGGMIRTTDGGMTWQRGPNGPHGLESLSCVGRTMCVALDVLNQVFVSVDGGNTWQQQTVPVDKSPFYEGRDQIMDLQLRSASRAYIFGIDTHLPPSGQEEVVKPDGTRVTPRYPRTSFLVKYDGNSWTRTNYDYIAGLGVGQFVDDLNGWAVSDFNNIFRTTDGGQTWTTVQDYFRQIAARTPTRTPFVLPTPTP